MSDAIKIKYKKNVKNILTNRAKQDIIYLQSQGKLDKINLRTAEVRRKTYDA